MPFAAMSAINGAAPIIEEVLHHTGAVDTVVGRSKTTAKERQEVDFRPVINPRGKNARNFDADIYFLVIANHRRVDNEDE